MSHCRWNTSNRKPVRILPKNVITCVLIDSSIKYSGTIAGRKRSCVVDDYGGYAIFECR